MTARGDLDLVLSEWMAASAHVVEPQGLHDGVVARVPTIRQRPGWLAGRAARGYGRRGRAMGRGTSLLAAAVAITVGGLVWSVMPGAIVPNPSASPGVVVPPSMFPSPTPSVAPPSPGLGRAEGFVTPFDYVIPAGSGLAPVDGVDHHHMIRWAVGRDHGVTVAASDQPSAHSSTGRFTVEGEPAEVLGRLRNLAGLDYGPVTPVELDGRPALATTIDDRDATDIHVVYDAEPGERYFTLDDPCRLMVASVGGNVVFITIWGKTTEERDSFMPTAMEFVNSIQFVKPVTERNETFVVPFDYAVPPASDLKFASGGPHRSMVSWVVGPDLVLPDQVRHYGGQHLDTGNVRGIVVASGLKPWVHGPGERFFLRTAPTDLLADLRGPGGVDVGVTSDTTLDGRPGDLDNGIADSCSHRYPRRMASITGSGRDDGPTVAV